MTCRVGEYCVTPVAQDWEIQPTSLSSTTLPLANDAGLDPRTITRQKHFRIPTLWTHSPSTEPAPLDFGKIDYASFLKNLLLHHVESGFIRIRLPLNPGTYKADPSCLTDPTYGVKPGFAYLNLKLEKGKISSFQMVFDPPFEVDPNIKLPIPDEWFGGKILGAHLDTATGKIWTDTEGIDSTELTKTFLDALNLPIGANPHFPMDCTEILGAIEKLQTSPAPSSSPSAISFTNPVFERVEIRIEPGTYALGPMEIKIDRGSNGNGNLLKIENSDLNTVHLTPPPIAYLKIPLLYADRTVELKDFDVGALTLSKKADKSFEMSGSKGKIGSVEVSLPDTHTVLHQGVSWETSQFSYDPKNGRAHAELGKVRMVKMTGSTLGEQIVFDTDLIENANISLDRTLQEKQEVLIAQVSEAEVILNTLNVAAGDSSIAIGSSHLKKARISIGVTRKLDETGQTLADGTAIEVTAGFSSPRLSILEGNIDTRDLTDPTPNDSDQNGYHVHFLPSNIEQVEVDLQPDRLHVRGNPNVYFSRTFVQFGVQRKLPFSAELFFHESKVTGEMTDFQLTNLHDKLPGGLGIIARGNLLWTGKGKGKLKGDPILHRFDIQSNDVALETELHSLEMQDGALQKIETGPLSVHFAELNGESEIARVLKSQLEKNSILALTATAVSADLKKYDDILKNSPSSEGPFIPFVSFDTLNLMLEATARHNKLSLPPSSTSQVLTPLINAGLAQLGSQLVVVYDPKSHSSKMAIIVPKNGSLNLHLDSQAPQVVPPS